MNIALRGPTRSSHAPNTAADSPRKTIAMLNTQPIVLSFQSSGADVVIPISREQRKIEHAERVRLPDREMDRQRRRRNEPARVARVGHGMLAIEKRQRIVTRVSLEKVNAILRA